MTLLPLRIPPGMKRAGTDYQSAGRWLSGNLVRFFEGSIRPVGGWAALQKSDATQVNVDGVPRAMLAWRADAQKAFGTLTLTGNALNNETVVIDGKTYTFQTTLTNVDGNVLIGASASVSIDNLIAAITLGAGAGTLYATATTAHPSVTASAGAGDTMTVTALAGGAAGNAIATTETLTNGSFGAATLASGFGGASLVSWLAIGTDTKMYAYSGGTLVEIAASLVGLTPSNYGEGDYGEGGYGRNGAPGEGGPLLAEAGSTWTLDNFGQYLVGVLTGDGKVRYWIPNTANLMVEVAPGVAPENCSAVVVTPERFLFALGAGGDPRKVQWPSQETLTDWVAGALNTAGEYLIETPGILMCGKRTSRETLLFTDVDVHAAIYVGGVLVYAFENRGRQCGAIGPNAVVTVRDTAYWMSDGGFFRYDGSVNRIPCEVFDYVFSRLNQSQRRKVVGVTTSRYGEVTWYYPSIGSDENDSYVTYNWLEDHWVTGDLGRSAGIDQEVWPYPVLAESDGKVWEHENGNSRAGQSVYLESGAVEIVEDGDRVYMLRQLLPDEKTVGQVTVTIFSRFQPNGAETSSGPHQLSQPTTLRVSGRQLRFRIQEYAANVDWRVGEFRFDGEPGGNR
jgi:hypothetical protein